MPTLQWLNREEALGGADAAPYRLLATLLPVGLTPGGCSGMMLPVLRMGSGR